MVFLDRIVFVLSAIMQSVFVTMFYAAFLIPRGSKVNRRMVYAGFGIAYFMVQCLELYAYSSMHVPEYGSMGGLVFSFCTPIISIVLVYLLSVAFFKRNLGMQIFLPCGFIAVMETGYYVKEIVYYTMTALYNTGIFHKSFYLEIAVSTLFYAAVCFLALRSITRSLSYRKQTFAVSELLYLLLPCVSGLVLVSVIKLLPYKIDFTGTWGITADIPFYEFLIPLAAIVFLFSLTVSVKLFQKLTELRIDERERIVLQKQTQQMREQIRDVTGIYTEIRSMRHDMKGHITNLQLLVKAVAEGNQNIYEDLEKYFGKLAGTLDKLDYAFQTENPITDIIIHQKYMEAKGLGIEFSTDFVYPAHLNIDVYDLAVILNNALENAAEACASVPQAKRFVHLCSYIKGEMFFIEVENSFAEKIRMDEYTNLPASTKPDKLAHGMGLSNIKRCAGKYYGDIDIQISQEKKTFLITVMLLGRAQMER